MSAAASANPIPRDRKEGIEVVHSVTPLGTHEQVTLPLLDASRHVLWRVRATGRGTAALVSSDRSRRRAAVPRVWALRARPAPNAEPTATSASDILGAMRRLKVLGLFVLSSC